jgi:hypothetical protein
VLDPINDFWKADEYIDDAQDEDSMTNSNPEAVKIV